MTKNKYSEVEPTDDEIVAELEELYPNTVYICGMEMNPAYILKIMDRVAFDQYANDNMQWYKCDVCETVYKDENAEEDAIECCQNHCSECGKEVEDDIDYFVLCDKCKDEEVDSESN